MSKYIYKNPKECIRSLKLIKEQLMYSGREETVNALETAINYLECMVIMDRQEGREYTKEQG